MSVLFDVVSCVEVVTEQGLKKDFVADIRSTLTHKLLFLEPLLTVYAIDTMAYLIENQHRNDSLRSGKMRNGSVDSLS